VRHINPPPRYECPYRNSCPHLGMLSTTWVYGQYQRAEEQYQQHLRIIDRFQEALKESRARITRLEQENAELKAKYLLIHQRQFKANRKTSGQRDIGERKKGEKKRGAPVGHQGWFRAKPEQIDRVVHVEAPTHCPYCHDDDLVPMSETTEHIQEDMAPPPPPVTTKYVHEMAWCKKCGKAVQQRGEDEIPCAHIGPLAKATTVYLRQDIGISYRKVQRMIKELFGLSFVPASALGFDRKTTANGLPIYRDILEKIRVSDVVHADETSWRSDGLGHYAWYAGNDDLAFFHLDRHRSAAVAQSIFGRDFNGVLVRDRYAAYNRIGRDWQACLAHISRNAKDVDKEHALLPQSKQDSNVNNFVTKTRELCSLLCETAQEIRCGKLSQETASAMEEKFSQKFKRICEHPFTFKPAEALRKFLSGSEQKHLFTFLRHPNVAPTNNQAEQTLRRLVIFRKICFGTRSQSGLEVHSVLPSLVLTAKRQDVAPLSFLKILLTKDTDTAQATLFNDSG
jgi:transposase